MVSINFLTSTISERIVVWGVAVALVIVLLWACLTLIAILLGWSQEARDWMEGRAWRYSLRELIVVTTAVAVGMAALSILVRWAEAM
jgi:hypothetical protein